MQNVQHAQLHMQNCVPSLIGTGTVLDPDMKETQTATRNASIFYQHVTSHISNYSIVL